MGKLLLTSGQVSVLLSSTIVCTFTLLLFLAGYVLQQQTLHALQATLRPRNPTDPRSNSVLDNSPQVPLSDTLQSSSKFGGSLNSPGRAAYQAHVSSHHKPTDAHVETAPDWTRLAHVQLVKTHESVCNSIMLFSALHRQRSPARRILLFPATWATDLNPVAGGSYDPFILSTRRLLKLAARRYRVELRPISPLLEDEISRDDAQSYSLASVFALRDLDRVMIVQTPGLLLDDGAELLDQTLAFAPPSALGVLATDPEADVRGDEMVLATPGKDTFAALRASELAVEIASRKDQAPLSTTFNPDVRLLSHVILDPLSLSPSSDSTIDSDNHRSLLTAISTLHSAVPDQFFNASSFLHSSPYILFRDPLLPLGPEYDVPVSARREARPKNKDADWVWTKLYGRFAQERMDVCGLDLEIWRG
ncbi:hypothetical protein AAFC00_005712 [Neodothiora populina]|uniref:Glycosyltransferase family 8 protein n=1 Tax=Neodothiora populina TaxID=2781224 RepID=A0ABR3P5V2_9PEZI